MRRELDWRLIVRLYLKVCGINERLIDRKGSYYKYYYYYCCRRRTLTTLDDTDLAWVVAVVLALARWPHSVACQELRARGC